MIDLIELSKSFAGVARPAVDRLSLSIPSGETCVLIGPSGCGKTTTMRMVNRLIEPSSGRIVVAGEDVTNIDPVVLRRRIGYVIQQIGLFPHMTIAANVATVPTLLKWDTARIDKRIDELLELVGLDPHIYRNRFPRELSGGQRQRIGVARALAADPPVMLMDEPFGAIDPITRESLQIEFLRILRELHKTVIFVTHDIDEAIRIGDRIAILKDGHLVQYGPPSEILTRPVNSFVAAFVGADRALKHLELTTVAEIMDRSAPTPCPADIPATASARVALSEMLAAGCDRLAATGPDGTIIGVVTLAAIRARAVEGNAPN